MTANELRIGNWVKHDSNWSYRQPDKGPFIEFDFQWNEMDWYSLGESTIFMSQIEPIHLTEEWLLKFGFYRLNNAWNEPEKKGYLTGFSIWNPPGSDDYSLNDTIFTPKIEYIHQLQNVYYALTNKEL